MAEMNEEQLLEFIRQIVLHSSDAGIAQRRLLQLEHIMRAQGVDPDMCQLVQEASMDYPELKDIASPAETLSKDDLFIARGRAVERREREAAMHGRC